MRQETRQNDQPIEKPQISLLIAYGTVREKMSAYLAAVLQQFPIPAFMVEGILSAMLADIRSEVITQLSGERETFDNNMTAYYEAKLEELEQVKDDLIAQFESRED